MESPEIWFEDFGGGRLRNGAAEVRLDPVFLETVTIDEAHPMRVYVTVTGDCRGVFVEKRADGFTVRELGGGTSSAGFDWRVVAKRKGTESLRLEPYAGRAEVPPPLPAARAGG